MHDQSRDELEQITKIKRIKNYEEMSKEELIISFLKSKESIVELFDKNVDDDDNDDDDDDDDDDEKISDIKRILNRLRVYYSKDIERKLKKNFMRKIRIFQKQKKKEVMNILEN